MAIHALEDCSPLRALLACLCCGPHCLAHGPLGPDRGTEDTRPRALRRTRAGPNSRSESRTGRREEAKEGRRRQKHGEGAKPDWHWTAATSVRG